MRRTRAALMRELRKTANLVDFGGNLPGSSFTDDDGDAIREATRIYRDSWLAPLLDEVERILCPVKRT